MRSNGSTPRDRSPVNFQFKGLPDAKAGDHVTKRLKNLIESLKRKSPKPLERESTSKTDHSFSKSLLWKKNDHSISKLVTTLKTSQQPTSQSSSPVSIEELRLEKTRLLAEQASLETLLRKTRVERLFWKEKVIDLERRIDKRLKQQIEDTESRSQSREMKEAVSKSQSVLFVRTYTSSKDGQQVLNTDISFS